VSGDAGTGVTVTLRDQSSGAVLSAVGPVTTLPLAAEHAGTHAAAAITTASVEVDATAIAPSGALDVLVEITDESYDPPVVLTLDEFTLTNGGSGAADLRYLKLFTLPPN
jgi:hypothetical protein